MTRVLRISELPDRLRGWLALPLPWKVLWLVKKGIGIVVATVVVWALLLWYNYPATTEAVANGSASLLVLVGPVVALFPLLVIVFVACVLTFVLPTRNDPTGTGDEGLRIRW